MVLSGGHRLPTPVNILTAVLVTLSYLITFVCSTPTITFPINAQLPPVARINEPFSFVFSPQTFNAQSPVNYALTRAPPWVSLTSSERLLSGTPPGDTVPLGLVVGVPISILATDASGSVQLNSTLVVTRTPAPVINIPLADQIASFGPFSAPDTLLLSGQENFSFSFDSQTFRSVGKWGLAYYAVNEDNTPLPSWIRFDASTLTFSGKTPAFNSPTQSPQKFNVKLIASDVVGFSALSIPFFIAVSNQRLTASQPVVQLNATRGRPFEYDDFLSLIKLDNRSLELTDVASVTPKGLPAWLAFDKQSWKFSGTPGANATASNFSVAVVDTYNNSLSVTFHVEIGEAMFNADLPPLNLIVGSTFNFQLRPYLVDPADTALSVRSNSDVSWIKVDQESLSISGSVPTTLGARAGEPFGLSVIATSKSTGTSQSQDLSVSIANTIASSQTSTTTAGAGSPASSSPTQTTGTPAAAASQGDQPKTYLWLLLPILLIIFVGAIILFFWFRRRQLRRQHRILKSEVSAPLPGTWLHQGAGGDNKYGSGYESGSETGRILGTHHVKGMSPQSPAQTRHAWTQRPSPPQAQPRSPTSPPPMSAMRPRRAVAERPKQPIVDRMAVQKPTQLSLGSDGQPRSASDSAIDGTDNIWRASPASQGNSTNVRSGAGPRPILDDVSLLSDTTIGEADMQALKNRSATSGGVAVLPAMSVSPEGSRGARSGAVSMLEVPPAHQNHPQYVQHHGQSEQRPLSIQPTPEMAYELPRPGPPPRDNKYAFESEDDDVSAEHPIIRYGRRDPPGSSGGGETRTSIRSTIGQRWSSALRRGGTMSSYGQHQKKTSDAASSVQTHTSILTSAMAEHTATTATNMASPVMVHIPSRSPNPRKQQQEQTQPDEVAPLFSSSGALNVATTTRSLKNSSSPKMNTSGTTSEQQETRQGQAEPNVLTEPPRHIFSSYDPSKPRPSDPSWDRFARDAVGVAHKDIIINHTRDEPNNAMGIVVPPTRSQKFSGRPKSPPPRPASLQSISEVAMSDSFGTSNAARAGSPLDVNSIGMALSAGSGWTSSSQKLSSASEHDDPGVSQARPRVPAARIGHRKSRSTGSLAAPSSHPTTIITAASGVAPMPSVAAIDPSTGPRGRQQPMESVPSPTHTHVPASQRYQTHSSNNQEPTTGYQNMASRPSQTTVESEGQWEDVEDEDDDDAWEDVRPPGSSRGPAWETKGGDSNGSFLVYI